ncbi:MAG: heterodisulfide reductase-related iron-sulfur binding cluster [Candidatus Dormibacteraeota bacterium]|nr:heterodisulfide reductase-related iron-sulfur binding cluster [Candidatus Dormibacteraeota bacterium]
MKSRLPDLDFKHEVERRGSVSAAAGMDMDLVRDCIHCGLCLPKCPTFRVLNHEGDSPRGRMWQIKEASLGLIEFDDPRFQAHIYQCFNCRACETACPSGVQFGAVMEMARAKTPPQNARDRMVRTILLNGLLPHPGRLRLAGRFYRAVQALRIPAFLRRTGAWRLLPLGKFAAFPPFADRAASAAPLPPTTAAQGKQRGRVGLLTGCIQDEMFHGTNRRTALALSMNGYEVLTPGERVCCGALPSHAGEAATAHRLAAATLAAFGRLDVEAVVVNAAGCGSNMKEYAVQLRGDPAAMEAGAAFSRMVRDASELLIAHGMRPPGRRMELRVAYQDPCHLLHGQRIQQQPRQVLQMIPGVRLVDIKEGDWCCGSAGIYNLTHPEIAEEALGWKVQHIVESGAQVVASANPGCILQIAMGLQRAGHDIPVVHVMDLLGWAYGDPGEAPQVVQRAMG